jgi:hypothetical protein
VISNGGYLYVVGGDDGSSNLASVECYDPKTNQWTLLSASMMTGRSLSINRFQSICEKEKIKMFWVIMMNFRSN